MAQLPRLFDDDFELRPEGPTDEQAAAVHVQVTQLTADPTISEEPAGDDLVTLLQSRRHRYRGATRTEVVALPDRTETLIVPGEILVRDTPETRERARRILRAAEFYPDVAPDGCGGLGGSIQRYHAPDDLPTEALFDVVQDLKDACVSAGPHTIMAQSARSSDTVVKSRSGPYPVDVSEATRARYQVPWPHDAGARRRRVAVIDTGIAVKETRKDAREERTLPRSDGWLNEMTRDTNIDPLDVFPQLEMLDFAAGHGTFAAGIVRQVDPEAEIVAYRALDSDGLGSEVDVAQAMVRAVMEGADVVNLSLGMRTYDDQPPVAIETALDTIDAYLECHPERERPVFVAAAGNYGDSTPVWPAASRRVVSVAGLTATREPASWSSRGVWVDCSTIGEGIVSTFVPGCEDPQFRDTDPNEEREPDSYEDPAWALWTGTSFAAPQVAAAISRLSRPNPDEDGCTLSPLEAARQVVRTGCPLDDFGRGLRILPGTPAAEASDDEATA